MASTSEAEQAFLQTFKVALATAIIRTRPAHLSSKQYAQQLANRICSAETSWKTKAENLSEELKETRQEMVLLQLKSEQLGPSDTVVTSLECLVSKGSMGFNDNQSEKPNNESKSKVDKLNSDNFLSAITRFEHWSETLRNNNCSLEIVKNNIRTSLEDFEKCLKTHGFDSQRFQLSLKSLQTLPMVLTNPAMHSDEQILKTCVKICELVIANILNNCDGNMKQADVLAEFLVSLSKTCQSIRDTCLARLVTVLCGYSQVLSNTVCVSRLDPQKYEAMFYVCRALDALNAQTSQRWPVDKDCFSELDHSLTDIAFTFPVYSHQVWTVTSQVAGVVHRDTEKLTWKSDF